MASICNVDKLELFTIYFSSTKSENRLCHSEVTACLHCSRWQTDESTRSLCIPVTPNRSSSTGPQVENSVKIFWTVSCWLWLLSITCYKYVNKTYCKKAKSYSGKACHIYSHVSAEWGLLFNPPPAETSQTKKWMNPAYTTVWNGNNNLTVHLTEAFSESTKEDSLTGLQD